MSTMKRKRLLRGASEESWATMLVGTGVVALLMPQRHIRQWKFGPRWWRRIVRRLARHPLLVRLIALAETALGLYWVYRVTERSQDKQKRKSGRK